jgi:hypothetical protein
MFWASISKIISLKPLSRSSFIASSKASVSPSFEEQLPWIQDLPPKTYWLRLSLTHQPADVFCASSCKPPSTILKHIKFDKTINCIIDWEFVKQNLYYNYLSLYIMILDFIILYLWRSNNCYWLASTFLFCNSSRKETYIIRW